MTDVTITKPNLTEILNYLSVNLSFSLDSSNSDSKFNKLLLYDYSIYRKFSQNRK